MTERLYDTTVSDDLDTTPTPTSDVSRDRIENATAGVEGSLSHGGNGVTGNLQSGNGQTDSGSTGTAETVKNEAGSVAADAAEGGRAVAGTATSGARDVVSEATSQLQSLFGQLRGELDDQASSQGQRAAEGLRGLADELRQMASGSEHQGLAGEAAGQIAERAGSAADWIENRQPGDMLDELRSFARRRPGAFLVGAAVVGVVGGRMTRSLAGGSDDDPAEGTRGAAV